MSLPSASLRFPRDRVLLPRTRLAYVHLRNLFTDAMRDRSARVFGYVCVWLPDEFLIFYMQEGEVVNVTASPDGQRFHPVAIADAIAKVPREAEYGEVCFHGGADELLATMHWTQVQQPIPWPTDLHVENPDAVIAHLRATMHDGVVEVMHGEGWNYVIVHGGRAVRGYFADDSAAPPEAQLRALLSSDDTWVRVRLWPVPPALACQASPALVQAYRDLMANAIRRLQQSGAHGAAAVGEQAPRHLMAQHPSLDRLAVALDALPTSGAGGATMGFGRSPASPLRDPIVDPAALSAAVGAWLSELLWTSPPGDGMPPERFLEGLLRERRHMFQMAGLFDALTWKLFA